MKEILHSVHGALETLKGCGGTNAPGMKKKGRCDDEFIHFNNCFNEMVIRIVVEVVIMN